MIYIYAADVYCEPCAEKIKAVLGCKYEGRDETEYDSDWYPKGPYPASEADYPQHCAGCEVFLENPLTGDGEEYVKQALADNTGRQEILAEWADYYYYLVSEEER